MIGNQIPYHLPSSFFDCGFFRVHFYRQTSGTCLLHTVLLVGVTDPCNSGVFIFESWIYMGISTFSNAHNFVKNLVWTSFYNPFWISWADLSFAPTFRVWRQILIFLLALSIKATVPRYSCWVTTWCMRCYFDLLRQPCQNVQEGNDLCYICMPNGTFWILVKIQPIKDTVHSVKIESEFFVKNKC